MSCFLTDCEPANRTELYAPIVEMNDDLIKLGNGKKVTPENLKYTLNYTNQEDEQCLFCRVNEHKEGVYTFYGNWDSLMMLFVEELENAVWEDTIKNFNANIFYHEKLAEIVCKVDLIYYDCLEFFKEKTLESLQQHRQYIKDAEYYMDWYRL